MSSRRAFTMVELLVVSALAAVILGAAYMLWIAIQRQGSDVEARILAYRTAQIAVTHLTREVQQARRLMYPAPGEEQDGLVVVNAAGLPRLFRLVGGELSVLEMDSGKSTVIAAGVRTFRARVPASPPGRDPRLVHVFLEMDGGKGHALPLMTSVRVRSDVPACVLDR